MNHRKNKVKKLSLALSLLVATSSICASPFVNHKFIPVFFSSAFFVGPHIVTNFDVQNFSITSSSGYQNILTNVPSLVSVTTSKPYTSGNIELVKLPGQTDFQGSLTISYTTKINGLSKRFTHTVAIGPDGKTVNETAVSDTILSNNFATGCVFDGNENPYNPVPPVNEITIVDCSSYANPPYGTSR